MKKSPNYDWCSDDFEQERHDLEARGFKVEQVSGEVVDFNANIFAQYIQKNFQICYATDGYFYKYVKGVWERMPEKHFLKFMREVLQKPRYGVWTRGCESEYISAMKRELYIDTPMNSYKELINLPNGMLDVNDRTLYEHDPEYYSAIRIPIEYDESADCPIFLEFLFQVFEGDKARMAVAQEWTGYTLSTDISAQKALILYGLGANGKSCFLSVLSALIGKQNISNVSLDELNRAFARVNLYNKTANISNENESSTLNTQYFKAIVSGDSINAEEKMKQGFDFTPTVKLVFAMNNLPDSRDKSDGYFRRLSILHFSAYFSENTRDVNLTSKLISELPGILNWALEGLFRLRDNEYKFSECRSMNELLQKYKEEQNPILLFIDEFVVDSPESRTENSVILKIFHEWAKLNGYTTYTTISASKFWGLFENTCKTRKIVVSSGHSGKSRYHKGFYLINNALLS